MRPSIFTDAEANEELIRAEPGEPTDSELETVERALAIARVSLRLPEEIWIRWRLHSSPDASLGVCEAATIYLGVGPHIPPELLGRTMLHELQHCSDFDAGLPWSRDAERRADAFADEMLPYWRSGTVPEPDDGAQRARASQAVSAESPREWKSARVAHLRAQISRRILRLTRRLPSAARELRVVERQAEELAALSSEAG